MHYDPAPGRFLLSLIFLFVMVGAFLGYLGTKSVHQRLADPTYYDGVLAESGAYDRMYADLARDPQFVTEVNALLGGLAVPQEELEANLRAVADPLVVRVAVQATAANVAAYVARDEPLDLSLDITPIIEAIPGFAASYTAQQLEAIPARQSASYADFVREFSGMVAALRINGTVPEYIPTYPIPPASRDSVAAIVTQAGGLDASDPADGAVIAEIQESIANDDLAGAVKAGAASLIAARVDAAIETLTVNQYVRKQTAGGEVTYRLMPSPETLPAIKDGLLVARHVESVSGWMQPACVVAFLVCSLLLVVVWIPRWWRATTWVGVAFVCAGGAGLGGWLAMRDAVATRAGDQLVSADSALPGSVGTLLRDAIHRAVFDLTPGISGPSLVLLASGVMLVLTSFVGSRVRWR